MLDEITQYKSDLDFSNEEIFKAYDIYMINRYLSHLDAFLPFIAELNTLNIAKDIHYAFLKNLVPCNRYNIRYNKKPAKDKERQEVLTCIATFYECGMREAEMYLDLMDAKQVREIVEIYSFGKNGKESSVN
jgi:hypothetical protein